MRKFHDITQQSEEWFDLRLGKITASNFAAIMANNGKAFGEPAKKYAMRVAIEDVTKTRLETYSNQFMERGIELEPIARNQYNLDNMVDVSNGGFQEFGRYGASSDGLVNDGMIEIKSVIYSTHFLRFINGEYDKAYKWQIQGQLWVYAREWCDFVSYCPEFPFHKNLYTYRVERNDEDIKQLEVRLEDFTKLVDSYINLIK